MRSLGVYPFQRCVYSRDVLRGSHSRPSETQCASNCSLCRLYINTHIDHMIISFVQGRAGQGTPAFNQFHLEQCIPLVFLQQGFRSPEGGRIISPRTTWSIGAQYKGSCQTQGHFMTVLGICCSSAFSCIGRCGSWAVFWDNSSPLFGCCLLASIATQHQPSVSVLFLCSHQSSCPSLSCGFHCNVYTQMCLISRLYWLTFPQTTPPLLLL